MQVKAWNRREREEVVNPEMIYKTSKDSTHKTFGYSGVHNNTPEMIREDDGINPTVDFKQKQIDNYYILKSFIPPMTSNDMPFGTASLAEAPFSNRQAYLAFDDDSTTAACGPTSGTSIDLTYKSKDEICNPTKILVGLMYSGTKLYVYGLIGTEKECIVTKEFENGEIPTNSTLYLEFDVSSDTFYEGFEFDVTGGSSTNTPQIAYAQVRGMVG